MRILVACEESGRVTAAFRKRGFDAFSCDILETSGDLPQYHIKEPVESVLYGHCWFKTQTGLLYYVDEWDCIIAFPPCTDLAASGARWFKEKQADGRQAASIEFFKMFTNLECKHVAIENPVGIMSTHYRKPDQIIQPWQFGHPYTKTTCLWLKGLPNLEPTETLKKPVGGWVNQSFTPDGRYGGFNGKFCGSTTRSKTFPGIAEAMAAQWGSYLESL